MRPFFLFSLFVTTPLLAQGGMGGMGGMHHDDPKPVEGGGKLPAGWSARVDRDQSLASVKFVQQGEGWHVSLGPAVVLFREADQASGNYSVSARFTQSKSEYPEGYGIVIGGSNLAQASQRYTYFLVRGDGKFIIKRRNGPDQRGENPSTIADWTDNAAINQVGDDGKGTNELAVTVSAGRVTFLANGKQLYSTEAAKVDTQGIIGLRANHNLDVQIDGFTIKKM